MTQADLWIAVTAASLGGLMFVTQAALRGWRDWLALRAREIEQRGGIVASPGARIELADLRERIRKLEAIAAGVDL